MTPWLSLDAYGGVDTQAAHEHYRNFSRTLVQTRTLDSLIDDLPSVQFIKIDAEGAEAAILAAGLKLIANSKPRLLVELHGIYEALACAEISLQIELSSYSVDRSKDNPSNSLGIPG